VMGVSASHSGFLTGPLMIGVVMSSMFNGRVLLRSGRYKPTQLVGLSTALAAFSVLAWGADTHKGFWVLEPAIFVLGLGLGLVMPNMTVAVQNALDSAHRGVGTATLAFFRSLGGLIGAAGSGAILTHHILTSQLSTSVGKHPAQMSPSMIAALPPADRLAVVELYRDAISTVFMIGVFIMGLALVAIQFLPELPIIARRRPQIDPAAAADGSA
jgi:MFS family permease